MRFVTRRALKTFKQSVKLDLTLSINSSQLPRWVWMILEAVGSVVKPCQVLKPLSFAY